MRLQVTGLQSTIAFSPLRTQRLFLLSAHEGRDRARGDPAFGTLHERQDLIAEAVAMKRGVRARHDAGLGQDPAEEIGDWGVVRLTEVTAGREFADTGPT